MNHKNLLMQAGLLVAPVFIGLSLVAALASPGFSLAKHEVSLLLDGPLGWLQMANFILTGLLGLCCALGLRKALHSGKAGTWGPILLGAYGFFLIVAAMVHPDPQLGFPVGAPEGIPMPQSAASGMHGLAFSLLALAIVVDGFVFARRFAALKESGWMVYSVANSIAIIVLVMLGNVLMSGGQGGLAFFGVALCISFWVSAMAWHTTHAARA